MGNRYAGNISYYPANVVFIYFDSLVAAGLLPGFAHFIKALPEFPDLVPHFGRAFVILG